MGHIYRDIVFRSMASDLIGRSAHQCAWRIVYSTYHYLQNHDDQSITLLHDDEIALCPLKSHPGQCNHVRRQHGFLYVYVQGDWPETTCTMFARMSRSPSLISSCFYCLPLRVFCEQIYSFVQCAKDCFRCRCWQDNRGVPCQPSQTEPAGACLSLQDHRCAFLLLQHVVPAAYKDRNKLVRTMTAIN